MESFAAVRFDHRETVPGDVVSRVRISRDNFLLIACQLHDPRHQFWGEESLAIIFENNRVDFREGRFYRFHHRRDLLRRRRNNFLPVDPYDLLLTRNDPRLHNGRTIIGDWASRRIDHLLR